MREKCQRLILLLAVLFSSCSKTEKKSPMQPQNMLSIGLTTEVRSLVPSIGIDDQSQVTITMLFEGLMSFDLNGQLTPAVCEKYEVSKDHKTYTFFLRKCNWSNGKPITAYDFEYSWKRVVGDNVRGSSVHNYYPIKNVEAVIKGQKSIAEIGVKAVDERTLVVELENPTSYFLEAVATSSFFPVSAEVDQADPNWANKVGADFVCNGAFMLTKHKHNDELILLKNPKYWDAENVKLAGIKIAIVKEALTQLNMFEKNELAWVGKPLSKLPIDALPALKKRGELTFVPSMGVYWYFLNTEAFPFTNKKMRKAFAYAINRQEITDHILQEGEMPALGVLPKLLGVHPEPYFPDHDLAKARQLFAEALEELGITKEELPPIVLSYNSSEYHQRTAQIVQEQWQKAFDIRIKIEHEEWKVHYQKLVSGNFQIGGMGWNSWLRDPIYIMQTFRFRTDGINMSRWEHPRYQTLISATEKEPDPEKRRALFYEAEKFLMEEMPVIPIYFNSICYAKKPDLINVYVSELNQVDFKHASFVKEK